VVARIMKEKVDEYIFRDSKMTNLYAFAKQINGVLRNDVGVYGRFGYSHY